MVEEMTSLNKSEAWDLVELMVEINLICVKWMFNKKLIAEGKAKKYKACLVVKGYSQVEGIDFGEIFSLVAKLTSIGFILFVAIVFLS
jgi:hypothetical protein